MEIFYSKIFCFLCLSSGRCQVTSAAFTKGFLDLEGDLTPILVQMVIRNAKAHALLDFSQTHIEARDRCKSLLDFKLNQVRRGSTLPLLLAKRKPCLSTCNVPTRTSCVNTRVLRIVFIERESCVCVRCAMSCVNKQKVMWLRVL